MVKSIINKNKGFTLIELLVVIAIIGTLSSVVLAGLQKARESANDARRKSDVDQILTALTLYRDKKGNYMQSGSGCGSGGNGNGWFNYQGGSYPKSMGKCLHEQGYTAAEIRDPSGHVSSTPTARNSYMKYSCTLNGRVATFVYAKLDGVPQSSSATNGTCCASCDSNYGMNYYKAIK